MYALGPGLCGYFFLQAEDGIRDLVRSRGLGDVYKRQALRGLRQARKRSREHASGPVYDALLPRFARDSRAEAVSYTHLTLPTSDLV